MRTAVVTVVLLLLCIGSRAGQQAAEVASPASAPAKAPVPARGGSPNPYRAPIQVPSAAGQIQSPALPEPSVNVTPVARPTFAGTCDSTGCWGSDGTRYNAVGGSLLRPDGRMCQNVGGVMQCQ